MIQELEITPEDVAEAALLPFRMSKNVVLEVRQHLEKLEWKPFVSDFCATLGVDCSKAKP